MTRIAWNKGITKYFPKPCFCGCGENVKLHKYPKGEGKGFSYSVNSFIKGHEKRGVGGFKSDIHSPRLCFCGCGQYTKKFGGKFNKFIKGHENIGRMPWNKGGTFSEVSRHKMRLARLGKEPANKVNVDLDNIYELYVKESKNASAVAKILEVSEQVIKSRIKKYGWSRSTKESCSSQEFRQIMQGIRVKALTTGEKIASPNKLEKLVYDVIDKSGIVYQKQVPLFNKFVVDIFFPQKLLILEVFGRYWHTMPKIAKKDYSKKNYLEKCGYKVEEIWDYEIKKYSAEFLLKKFFKKYNLL